MRPTEGPQKETGQLGGFNDETGAQSRVHTNRNRLLLYSALTLSLYRKRVVERFFAHSSYEKHRAP